MRATSATRCTSVRRSLRGKSSDTTHKGLERAGEILDAARTLFAEQGAAGLSMRAVASRVAVTLGTVQHYYPTKEALLEAMLTRTLEELQREADQMAAAQKGSPSERFRVAMRYFAGTLQSPARQATFLELKSMSLRDPFAAAVMDKVLVRAQRSIARRIAEVAPQLHERALQERSTLILAQLMGLSYLGRARGIPRVDDASIDVMLAIARGLAR